MAKKTTKAEGKAEGKTTKIKAKGKKAEGKKTEGELLVPEVLDGSRSEQVRQELRDARRNVTTTFYNLACNLHEAWENEYHLRWNFDSFKEYVEQELGEVYRKTMYIVNCGKTIKKLGLKADQVEGIGWTKFKEVAPILLEDPSREKELLKLAGEKSASELKDELDKQKRELKGVEAKPPGVRLNLKFYDDAANVVNSAIAVAAEEIGKQDVSMAVNHIMAEWLMAKNNPAEGATLDDWTAYLEKTYGVKLQRVEAEEDINAILGSEEENKIEEEASSEMDSVLEQGDDSDVEKLLGVS